MVLLGVQETIQPQVGNIFEDSSLGLDKWMCAYWILCNSENGVSSCELAGTLGVTQKSAWFMLHRIRTTLHDDSTTKLSGEIEADETFIGGKARNMHLAKKARRITGTGTKTRLPLWAFLNVAARSSLPLFQTARRLPFQAGFRGAKELYG